MDAAATFFFVILCLQMGFVAAMILLVGRRFPQRLFVYRWVAPAALPLLLFALASFSYVANAIGSGVPAGDVPLAPIARLFLADAVLWLVGVLFASLLMRITRRGRSG